MDLAEVRSFQWTAWMVSSMGWTILVGASVAQSFILTLPMDNQDIFSQAIFWFGGLVIGLMALPWTLAARKTSIAALAFVTAILFGPIIIDMAGLELWWITEGASLFLLLGPVALLALGTLLIVAHKPVAGTGALVLVAAMMAQFMFTISATADDFAGNQMRTSTAFGGHLASLLAVFGGLTLILGLFPRRTLHRQPKQAPL